MEKTHFLIHHSDDSVGVVTVEGVEKGHGLNGYVMGSDEAFKVEAQHDIPLGHKVALAALKTGDTIIKYGHDIGRVVADIPKGGHVHVHNVKTKRW